MTSLKTYSTLSNIVQCHAVTSPKTDFVYHMLHSTRNYICKVVSFWLLKFVTANTEIDKKCMIDACTEKLKGPPEPKFKFVKAVGKMHTILTSNLATHQDQRI